MAAASKPRRELGLSIPQAANALNVSLQAMRKAIALEEIALEEIEVVTFAGQRRIPQKEVERIKRQFATAAE